MKRQRKLFGALFMMLLCLLLALPAGAATVKINKSKATLIKGQTLQLKVTGTKIKPVWSSSRNTVAAVSKNGKVTAKKKGTATITAKIKAKKYTCKITVETPSLSKKSVTVTAGKSTTIKLNGTKQKVTWKTSNSKVATVKNGKITGKSAGTANITATVLKKKYTCKVTVKKAGNSGSSGKISYRSASTDYGAVIIAKNNYPYMVDLQVDCIYYKKGVMNKKSTCRCYAFEPGRECALRAWNGETTWDSYKIIVKATKASSNIIGNASKIKVVSSNFGETGNVLATVKNKGKKNEYTELAVVYYQKGKIVGYDSKYADVKNPGSTDYVEFYEPFDRSYYDIYADSYKIYVNESYTYTWLN